MPQKILDPILWLCSLQEKALKPRILHILSRILTREAVEAKGKKKIRIVFSDWDIT